MTIAEIRSESPVVPGHGQQMVFYSAKCCWWTSFPEDLGKKDGEHPIPLCPHCGSPLYQGSLEGFIRADEKQPDHYGHLGLGAFAASHHRNSSTCHGSFDKYEAVEP